MKPEIEGIDHVEIVVPARGTAVEWLRSVFGLRPLAEEADGATDGPVFMTSPNGRANIALFESDSAVRKPLDTGIYRVAFRLDAEGFMSFITQSEHLPLYDQEGLPVGRLAVVDHQSTWSAYFCDPFGNRFEVTTHDYEAVRLRSRSPQGG